MIALFKPAVTATTEVVNMNTTTASTSVLVNAQGSVIMQCKKCGMLLADKLILNGATVKCPYCHSNYHYTVKLEAKAV
jgi:Zn finger protein HypA/HybF involved in hydrogenase expression